MSVVDPLQLRLQFLDTSDKWQDGPTLLVYPGQVTRIGRFDFASLARDDPRLQQISIEQLEIYRQGEEWCLKDHSLNGTRVTGTGPSQPLLRNAAVGLLVGDVLELGGCARVVVESST